MRGGAPGAEIVGERKPVLDLLEDGDFDPVGQVLAQREFDALPQQAVVPRDEGSALLEAGIDLTERLASQKYSHDVELGAPGKPQTARKPSEIKVNSTLDTHKQVGSNLLAAAHQTPLASERRRFSLPAILRICRISMQPKTRLAAAQTHALFSSVHERYLHLK